MWFVFPQLAGLGHSETARHYAISSIEEARAYVSDPTLGPRLRECALALLETEDRTAQQVLGETDASKLPLGLSPPGPPRRQLPAMTTRRASGPPRQRKPEEKSDQDARPGAPTVSRHCASRSRQEVSGDHSASASIASATLLYSPHRARGNDVRLPGAGQVLLGECHDVEEGGAEETRSGLGHLAAYGWRCAIDDDAESLECSKIS